MNDSRGPDELPDVTLVDDQERHWCLSKRRKEGPVLLVFFRGAWCFLSRRALAALRSETDRFAKADCQVAAASPDPPDKLVALRKRLKLEFTLLSDPDCEAADLLGVPYERRHECPFPSAFLVNEDGTVLFRHLGRSSRDWPDWSAIARKLALERRRGEPTDEPAGRDG